MIINRYSVKGADIKTKKEIVISLTIFNVQDTIAKKLINKPGRPMIVKKTTRAGATTSLLKIAISRGKRIVIFEPNKMILAEIQRIIKELVPNDVEIAFLKPNNELCKKSPEIPGLKLILKESCRNCEYKKTEKCEFQKILNNKFLVYLLTYDKLRALQNSPANEAKQLLKELQSCQVFILDEFTKAILLSLLTLNIREIDKDGNLSKLRDKINHIRSHSEKTQSKFELILWSTIDFFLDQCENINDNGMYSNEIINIFSDEDNRKAFAISWKLITQLQEAGYDTTLLQDLTLIAFSKNFTLTNEKDKQIVSPALVDALGYLREFFNSLGSDKIIFIVDACLPAINYDGVFKLKTKQILWGSQGDPLQNNLQQLLICDSAHWGSNNFVRDKKLQGKIKKFLNFLILRFSPEKILITATNKKIIRIISKWGLPKSVKITWFRSDLMRGLSIDDRRILVCIGGPYLPKVAYTREAESFEFNDLVKDLKTISENDKKIETSKLLRLFDTKSEFINAIGRPKDPRAKERSVVFLFGMQKYEVGALLKQNDDYPVSTPYVVEPIRKGGFVKDGLVLASLWLNNITKELTAQHVEDLPIVSRIIRLFIKKTRLRASEVIPHDTKKVVDVAKRNCELLKHHNINLRKIQGGYIFEK